MAEDDDRPTGEEAPKEEAEIEEEEQPAEGGKEVSPPEKADEEEQVPVRRSAAHIIGRQRETISKLRSKLDEAEPEVDTGGEKDDEEEELTPESKSAVQREILRQMEPLKKSITNQADEAELQELFQQQPEARNYEKKIRAYMSHPAYSQASVAFIYRGLSYDQAGEERSKHKQTADAETRLSRGGGTSRRPPARAGKLPSPEEIEEMSEEEFEKTRDDVLMGKFTEE